MTYLNKACKLSLKPFMQPAVSSPHAQHFLQLSAVAATRWHSNAPGRNVCQMLRSKKMWRVMFLWTFRFWLGKLWFPRNHDTTDPCSEVLRDVLIQPELHKLQTLREIDVPPWAPRPWPGLRTQQTHWRMARKSPKFPKVHQTFVGKVRPCNTCDFWFP